MQNSLRPVKQSAPGLPVVPELETGSVEVEIARAKSSASAANWLMGLTNAPFGLTGGFCAVIIPQLLAAHGIPAGHVAAIASAILSPGFWIFTISPVLDAWLSRRTYALIFGSLTAVAVALTVVNPGPPRPC